MKNLFPTFATDTIFLTNLPLSSRSFPFLLKIKFLDKNPSHFIDANRFPNMYTYEQETIITHSLFEAQLHPSDRPRYHAVCKTRHRSILYPIVS